MSVTKYESIQPNTNVGNGEDQTSMCSSHRGYKIRRWMGIRRSTWLLSLYIVAYITYLVGGCTLFTCLEQGVEEEKKTGIHLRKKEFIAQNPGVAKENLEKLIDVRPITQPILLIMEGVIINMNGSIFVLSPVFEVSLFPNRK
jgi:hypothetical protein